MFEESNIFISYSNNNPLAVLDPPRKEPRRYTLAEFLRRVDQKEGYYEYYDGIITKLPMARGPHNTITANTVATLHHEILVSDKDYIVMSGQQLVYLPTLNFSLNPDVLVVTDTPQYFDANEVLLINPIVIIEILSRSTKKYDRTDKFEEYQTLDSFKEYVLIDQNKCRVEVRHRTGEDTWVITKYTDISSSILLKSIGCKMDLAKIYRKINLK